jgi:hypothetical protein
MPIFEAKDATCSAHSLFIDYTINIYRKIKIVKLAVSCFSLSLFLLDIHIQVTSVV